MQTLIIDDHSDTLDVLRLFLETNGYVVATAESVTEALQKLSAFKTEIVLLDYCLPGLTPHAFVQVLRSDMPGVKVILMSGVPDIDIKAREIGADGYLSKPIDPTDLMSLMYAVAM